jgi:hypothetical protein
MALTLEELISEFVLPGAEDQPPAPVLQPHSNGRHPLPENNW